MLLHRQSFYKLVSASPTIKRCITSNIHSVCEVLIDLRNRYQNYNRVIVNLVSSTHLLTTRKKKLKDDAFKRLRIKHRTKVRQKEKQILFEV